MTPERIAEIRAMLEAATPGPWEAHHIGADWWAVIGPTHTGYEGEVCESDARVIATAPTIVAELLAEVERLREALDEAQAHISYLESFTG